MMYDAVGIGAGPFNLGFAALADGAPELSVAVFEAAEDFAWHPGMMLPGTHLQVPFMADLVTLADPTSEYSFLNYLKLSGRLYPFYIRENFYALRREYSDYLRWAAHRLDSVHFSHTVTGLEYDDGRYLLTVQSPDGVRQVETRQVVLGTGTQPWVPDAVEPAVQAAGQAFHSSDYTRRRADLDGARRAVVVGSGQSAAEIVADLLAGWVDEAPGRELTWMTRSPRFFPLEYTKLTLEMTSPDYIDHFHGLPADTRDRLGAEQRGLYKGINADLINQIHEQLYQRHVERGPGTVRLKTATALESLTQAPDGGLRLTVTDADDGGTQHIAADAAVLATGYRYREPAFLAGIADRIHRGPDGRFAVDREYGIGEGLLVQNAELHTHGFTAPDLGMGAYRNSVILNRIAGREVYPVERRIAYQEFGSALPTHRLQESTP
ncbi:lysine N(6)-hydroxylase/L-ornithine N(5)-oxygenase family protein [Zhihengliuella flava]|uniref:L-lysine N6-monooxygenase MbtG n=1 Tax=Zhihengliuella flava TaxID=1285193 RepID=A0A931D484_9MICC|nr:SidA/IucD/PvdA family monooxygenase [Zhihengliuella flava]MBG6084119.1 lysine N6-hydroxylase [Zhihengliuella flava]